MKEKVMSISILEVRCPKCQSCSISVSNSVDVVQLYSVETYLSDKPTIVGSFEGDFDFVCDDCGHEFSQEVYGGVEGNLVD
jgi:hypothetical protein